MENSAFFLTRLLSRREREDNSLLPSGEGLGMRECRKAVQSDLTFLERSNLNYYKSSGRTADRGGDRVIRRQLLLALALSLPALAAGAWAQEPSRVPVIGILMISAGPDDPLVEAITKGLRDRGYVEGRDFRIAHRGAHGQVDRLPRLAEELVRLNAAAIVTGTEEATLAARQATSTIPIVAVLAEDPVASGFIESFNRPGGNITGLFTHGIELGNKRLELLKETVPGLSLVAVVWDSQGRAELEQLKPAARSLGIQLQLLEMTAPYDLDTAFRMAKRKKAGAVVVLDSSSELYVRRARLGSLALANGLPLIGETRDLVKAGGLMSYSMDVPDQFYRATYFIDRLLKGAKASDLPFEQIARIKLVVNLKAAKALGLTIPESVLLRADEVIR